MTLIRAVAPSDPEPKAAPPPPPAHVFDRYVREREVLFCLACGLPAAVDGQCRGMAVIAGPVQAWLDKQTAREMRNHADQPVRRSPRVLERSNVNDVSGTGAMVGGSWNGRPGQGGRR